MSCERNTLGSDIVNVKQFFHFHFNLATEGPCTYEKVLMQIELLHFYL